MPDAALIAAPDTLPAACHCESCCMLAAVWRPGPPKWLPAAPQAAALAAEACGLMPACIAAQIPASLIVALRVLLRLPDGALLSGSVPIMAWLAKSLPFTPKAPGRGASCCGQLANAEGGSMSGAAGAAPKQDAANCAMDLHTGACGPAAAMLRTGVPVLPRRPALGERGSGTVRVAAALVPPAVALAPRRCGCAIDGGRGFQPTKKFSNAARCSGSASCHAVATGTPAGSADLYFSYTALRQRMRPRTALHRATRQRCMETLGTK
jgi:hypothetical protein